MSATLLFLPLLFSADFPLISCFHSIFYFKSSLPGRLVLVDFLGQATRISEKLVYVIGQTRHAVT